MLEYSLEFHREYSGNISWECSSNIPLTYICLLGCNTVNNNCQKDSRVLYTFAPNKSFYLLLNNSPKNFIFLKLLTQSFHILKYEF